MTEESDSTPRSLVVVHMRNDLSGSTRVLAQAVEALISQNVNITLYTATIDYQGFLSDLPDDVEIRPIPYKRRKRRWRTFFSYIYVQIWLFFSLLKYAFKPTKIYINTVLPFGAALAGRLMRKEIIYHVHEISLAPAPTLLKKWLFFITKLTASKVVFVSEFLRSQVKYHRAEKVVIHNSLPESFFKNEVSSGSHKEKFRVLMVCSLAEYKGVPEFIELAKLMPDTSFDLVLNATDTEIQNILHETDISENMTIYPAQKKVEQFYKRASIVLNLSDANKHIETFGMTILEGMAFGLPCIVPTVGGVLELVDHGKNGFSIDSTNLNQIIDTIEKLRADKVLYNELSENAVEKAKLFDPQVFQRQIKEVVLSNN